MAETNNYINLRIAKPYLVGTNFEIKSEGMYSATTVTCLSGDSLFSDQVSRGDLLRFSNSDTSYIDIRVKSITSATVLVVEADDDYDSTGKRYARYCKNKYTIRVLVTWD